MIELMVVITVVAILVILSYPSYVSFIRKADRVEARVDLLDWANRQDIWRADHITYSADMNPPDTETYVYTIVSTATSYTLTATARGSQLADTERGISCGVLTLNQAGVLGPADNQVCWG